MNFQYKTIGKYALTAVLVVLCAMFYAIKKVNAVTQTTLTGSCGMLINYNYNGWDNIITERTGSQITKSAIGVVNFDTSKAYFELTVNTNYGGGSFNSTTPSEATNKITADLTLNSFDTDTGIYKYNAVVNNTNETLVMTVVPVNSGNTFLISGQTPVLGLSDGPGMSGVCQKI